MAGTTLSIAVGAPRANAKPVLALHNRRGEVVLWAKTSTNDLTAGLVRHEHHVLSALATRPPASFEAPATLGLLDLATGPALLMRPLVSASSRPAPADTVPADVVAVVAELATRAGVVAMTAGRWSPLGPDAPREATALLHLWHSRHRGPVPVGAWHGDFGPWNMRRTASRAQVWDWERAETGAPLGVDAVHYGSHVVLRGQDVRASLEHLRAVAVPAVERVLRAAGAPDTTADAVVDAYLLLVHRRFASEGAAEGTGAVLALAAHYAEVLRARPDPSAPRHPHDRKETEHP
ncbi:hypothetical protein [Aquipuribacter sp. SD81]|uniref:hypothetical protein n=1 Tax=Aquipuribacter sp. SD81 TaxID=3127703 RepID=UPI0030197AA8